MTRKMGLHLSLNELRAVLRRSYEALYHHGYDFDVMARSCLWLETHGLDGIGLTLRSLPDLEKPCGELQLSEISTGCFELDGQGRCLIPFVNASADLAIAAAQDDGLGQIDILNVYGQLNIFAVLKKPARLNLYAAAIWYDEGEERTHILWLQPSSDLPNYYILNEVHQGPRGGSGLRFICANTSELVIKNIRAILTDDTIPYKTSEDFTAAYERALEEGVVVSPRAYATLNKIADRLLVPSTDASRKGAGE